MRDVDIWLNSEGEKVLRDIGIKPGQKILDFGCGEGHYAIPTAIIVGAAGKVYAYDKDRWALQQLVINARSKRLNNIEIVQASDDTKFNFKNETFDLVLVYDVLHPYYFPGTTDRKSLLMEIYRVLKKDGSLSIIPKHIDKEKIIEESKKSGFYLEKEYSKRIIHDNSFEIGEIEIFKKEPAFIG